MGKIIINEDIYKDIRFLKLVEALGSVELALGAIARMAFFTKKRKKKFPELRDFIWSFKWEQQELNKQLISCGFAEFDGDCKIFINNSYFSVVPDEMV